MTNKKPVFVHVPKTAGASIVQVCMRSGVAVIGHDIRDPRYQSLAQCKLRYPEIYSFAVVRNPWDRVVSSYHFLKGGGLNEADREDAEQFVSRYKTFDHFIAEGFKDSRILQQIHFRPQYEWLSNDAGLVVDVVGRFEKLQAGCRKWFRSIGVPLKQVPKVNAGRHKPYKVYYSEKTIGLVREIYVRDIDLFNYKF